MAAAKRLRARATTTGARAAAAKQIAAIAKKQRKAAAEYRQFGCKAIETAAFCKAYPKLSTTLAKQLAAAKKAAHQGRHAAGEGRRGQEGRDADQAAEGGDRPPQDELQARRPAAR